MTPTWAGSSNRTPVQARSSTRRASTATRSVTTTPRASSTRRATSRTGSGSFSTSQARASGTSFLKHFGYNAFNLLSFGALSRQDTLVEQSEAGQITEGRYHRGTAINAGGTGATAAATFATGGVAGQAAARASGSLILAGAASGGTAGLVASTGSADVDMATGTRSPLDVHPTEFVAPTVLGAASGAVFGTARARVPTDGRAYVVVEGRSGAELVPVEGPSAVRPHVPDPPRIPAVRGRTNAIPEQGPFFVSESGVARTQRGITRLDRPGFVEFEGMEVRGARDLSHVPETTLRAMQGRASPPET